jgi:origin recognition complex subunit 1
VDPPRGIFYSFAWDKHRTHALDAAERDVSRVNEVVWCVAIDEGPTRPMKRKVSGAEGDIESESDGNSEDEFKASEDEEEEVDDHDQPLTEEDDSSVEEGYELPKTPARKRKRGRASASASPTKWATSRTNALSTPRKPRQRQTVQPTPHSKKALAQRNTKKLRKSPLKVRPPPPTPLSPRKQSHMQTLPKDPWLRATHALHVAARPDGVQLPCREDEYAKILRSVEELVGEGSGGCVCESLHRMRVVTCLNHLQIYLAYRERGRPLLSTRLCES